VEQEGIRRAWAEIETADRILMVVDDQLGLTAEEMRERLPANTPVTVLYNKIDLSGRLSLVRNGEWGTEILLSAKTESGLDLLREHLKSCMGYHSGREGTFMARRRHLEALEQAAAALERAWNRRRRRWSARRISWTFIAPANWWRRNCARPRTPCRKLPANLRPMICYRGFFPVFVSENSDTSNVVRSLPMLKHKPA